MTVGFIGLGNMGKAVIGGMLEKGFVANDELIGSDKSEAILADMKKQFGITTTSSNVEVVKKADILFLAVKPQFFPDVIGEIKDVIKEKTLVISIAAGKTIPYIEKQFGKKIKLVRCMPNTPALVLSGCTGVCANDKVSPEEMKLVMTLLSSFGEAIEVTENLMDAVVGVSGSAPAYVFMFIEAMADAAVAGGMPREMAYKFAAQAVMGSAKMMLQTGKHPGELKDQVCSPAGTTIAAVKVLEEKGFRAAIMDAVEACIEKSRKM